MEIIYEYIVKLINVPIILAMVNFIKIDSHASVNKLYVRFDKNFNHILKFPIFVYRLFCSN